MVCGTRSGARRALIAAWIGAIALCARAADAQQDARGLSSADRGGPTRSVTTRALATGADRASLVAPSELLDAAEADVRTAWIQARLDAETPAAQRWYWIFLVLNAGAMTGQLALGAAFPDFFGPSMYVGAVNGAIGTLPMVVFPFAPAFAAGRLRSMPADTPARRIARARRAESLLRESAEGEAFGQSWISHGLGVVVAVGSSLVVWLGFHQAWYWVVTNLVTTVAFNEIQVLTQPMQLVADWDTYRRAGWRNLARGGPRSRHDGSASSVRVMPMPFPGGAGVAVTF
jgi:hypothetical protein